MNRRFALLAGCVWFAACGSEAEPRANAVAPAAAAAPEAASAPAPRVKPTVADPAARTRLSETGLFSDFALRVVSGDVVSFTPRHTLWTDDAKKRRWIRLPEGATVDATDPDRLSFPIGTQVWKEFARDGRVLETRLIERTGPGTEDYWMGSFVWLDDGSDAIFAKDGAVDVGGTTHDVPAQKRCWSCHAGEPGRVLGFSRFQLDDDVLSPVVSPALPPRTTLDGDDVARAAVGYLHANCGHCHNDKGIAWPDTNMVLRIGSDEGSVASSRLFATTVGQATLSFKGPGKPPWRVAPGDPSSSAVVVRMQHRGDAFQMPPLGTEIVDDTGLQKVTAWVSSLAN